jgi:hypothetical protein
MRHLVYYSLGKVIRDLALTHIEWSSLSLSGLIQVLGFGAFTEVCMGIAVLEPCLPLRTESLADGLVVPNIIAHVKDIAIGCKVE